MIKPIETQYAGRRFRSRLEARWATFFDHLEVEWEYEPDGFETSAGRYLPDFRISIPQMKDYGHRQWFEVKPPGAPVDSRHSALAAESDMPLIVARGMPRSHNDQMQTWQSPLMVYGIESRAWPVAFCDSTSRYGQCYCTLGDQRHWCMDDMNNVLRGNGKCHLALYGEHEDGNKTYPPFEGADVDAAYAAALSARFGT